MKGFIKTIINYAKYYNKKIKFYYNVSIINSKFERYNSFGSNTIISNSSIGYGSYCGQNCILSNVKIGRFTSIGNGLKIIYSTHPLNGFVSTSPMFYSLRKQSNYTFVNKQKFPEITRLPNSIYSVEIGSDVWIGEDVKIIGGVKIGDGAVIATGAVVTKDILPYSIVAGIPAVVIKYRFEKETINSLLKIRWWENVEFVEKNAELFENVNIFIKKFI